MKKSRWPQRPTSKFKSKLEEDFSKFLSQKKILWNYENFKISYLKPEKISKYIPDFDCPTPKNIIKIILETKGQFLTSDRRKHLLIKEQHPNLDVRFVFSNSKNKIGKKSKTTYGKWCELKGFKYHCIQSTGKFLPEDWINEILEQQTGLTNA